MNKNQNPRIGYTKLYNQKQEGIGCYDINYINAYKKSKEIAKQVKHTTVKRQAA